MAVEYKDYYELLGVSRGAGAEEVRRAFRVLARQYHPDVAGNRPGAEAVFREINEAYEVLSDPARRKHYDAWTNRWRSGSGFASGGYGSRRPQPDSVRFGGTGFSEFFEELFGEAARKNAPKRSAPREEAEPHGQDVESDLLVSLREVLRGGVRPITFERQELCFDCFGVGGVNGRVCPKCNGDRHTRKRECVQIKIPPGIKEGQRLRLAGQAERGPGQGRAGDLFLRVRLEKHPYLRVEEENLSCDLELAPWEAVLGAEAAVPGLEGEMKIKIPPGSRNGGRLRLRGHGLPDGAGGRGDLFVVLRIQVPAQIGERERALWEELARASEFSPRR